MANYPLTHPVFDGWLNIHETKFDLVMSASDWQRSKQQRYTMAGFVNLTLWKTGNIPEVFWRTWTTSNEKGRSFQDASQSWRAFDVILFDSLSHSCARLVADSRLQMFQLDFFLSVQNVGFLVPLENFDEMGLCRSSRQNRTWNI